MRGFEGPSTYHSCGLLLLTFGKPVGNGDMELRPLACPLRLGVGRSAGRPEGLVPPDLRMKFKFPFLQLRSGMYLGAAGGGSEFVSPVFTSFLAQLFSSDSSVTGNSCWPPRPPGREGTRGALPSAPGAAPRCGGRFVPSLSRAGSIFIVSLWVGRVSVWISFILGRRSGKEQIKSAGGSQLPAHLTHVHKTQEETTGGKSEQGSQVNAELICLLPLEV